MSATDSILWKFVRMCVNRAYANVDFSRLSGEERTILDTLVEKLRSDEDSWRSVDDFINYLRGEFKKTLESFVSKFVKGRDVILGFIEDIIKYFGELDEVSSNPELNKVYKELIDFVNDLRRRYGTRQS